jgi:cytidylate kinase
MVQMGRQVMERAAAEGHCVIVGRGAPYIMRGHADAFHVFLYAPYEEKLRRLRDSGRIAGDPEEMLKTIDRDRSLFVKKYFHADWPTRSLYHLMVNTAVGDEAVILNILQLMRTLEKRPVEAITSFPEHGKLV